MKIVENSILIFFNILAGNIVVRGRQLITMVPIFRLCSSFTATRTTSLYDTQLSVNDPQPKPNIAVWCFSFWRSFGQKPEGQRCSVCTSIRGKNTLLRKIKVEQICCQIASQQRQTDRH